MAKNLSANARDVRDEGSIPGSERSHGTEGTATHSRILVGTVPCTKEPGGLQSAGLQRVRHN